MSRAKSWKFYGTLINDCDPQLSYELDIHNVTFTFIDNIFWGGWGGSSISIFFKDIHVTFFFVYKFNYMCQIQDMSRFVVFFF